MAEEVPEVAITAALPDNITLTEEVSVLNCIGIEFFQKVGTRYYLLSSGNSLKIEKVF